MPAIKTRMRGIDRRAPRVPVQTKRRRIPSSRCKLDTSPRLIAPAHTLTLPSLEGVRDRFKFSFGHEKALLLGRALIEGEWLRRRHLQPAASPVDAIERALIDIVSDAFCGARDEFDITLGISDHLDDYRKPDNVLFFVWNNSMDPQYIPLRPVFERLEGNPRREALMASLYQWLYGAASRVVDAFGFDEAKNVYMWRRECYMEAREGGEDVDLEGEVESADPAKVASYIQHSNKLMLKDEEGPAGIASIIDEKVRSAFAGAHRLYVSARKIQLPTMTRECEGILHDAAYYMDAYPMPGLGLSHWRDDPIVAWLDEFCQEQFESGVTCRAPMILCFRPQDTRFFMQIVEALPGLVRTIAGLSEWVRFAQELEHACDYGNRHPA